jgi:tetratricopeptide (TPR) repeat protein
VAMNEWQDAEQRVEKAQELFSQQKWLEALEELRAAVAINPYNSAWHFNMGLTLDEMGRFEEAVEAYEQAVRIAPEDIEGLHHLGRDLARVGKLLESLKTLEQIERLDPDGGP